MYLLNNVFTNEHGEAITVLQLITKIKTSISQIDEVLNTYLIRLDAIDIVNNTQNTDILVLKGNVDLLKSQVANIFTSLGDYLLQLQQLDILTHEIEDINAKIQQLEKEHKSINESLLKKSKINYKIFQTVQDGYLSAKQNVKNNDMIFIGGSNFIIGEFLEKNL